LTLRHSGIDMAASKGPIWRLHLLVHEYL